MQADGVRAADPRRWPGTPGSAPGLGDLSAGEDADAIGIQEQTGHHGRIEGRGVAGLVLVGGMDAEKVELGDDIDQVEDQVIVRELGGRRVACLA